MIEHSDSADNMKLGAYLDGELSPPDLERMQERLAREPRLAERLERMKRGDEATRRYYRAIDELPLPGRIGELLDDAAMAGQRAQTTGKVLAFPRRAARSFLKLPVAIAASVALLAGYLVAGLAPRGPVPGEGWPAYARQIESESELHRLLESGVSTESQSLADGTDARPILTFADTAGDYCRQFRLDGPSGSMQALACRRAGSWHMEAAAFDDALPRDGGGFQPASAGTAAALGAAIDARIGAAEPLDAEQERRLISSGWKNTPQ